MVNRDLEAYVDDLYSYDFFSRLTIDEANTITKSALFHHIPKGQLIFFNEDPIFYTYFVFKGLVRLEHEDALGEYSYLDYVAEGSFFPYAEFLFKDHHIYNAYAATDLDLAYIPKKLMEEIVINNPKQLKYMYENLAAIQYYMEKRVQMNAVPSASSRVVRTLAILMYDLGKFSAEQVIISHPITIIEVAAIAGTTRETAGRVIKELKEEGKLTFHRQGIIFHDWKFFNKLVE